MVINSLYLALEIAIAVWILLFVFRKRLQKYGFIIYPFILLWRRSAREEWLPSIAYSKYFKKFEMIAVGLGIIAMIAGIFIIFYTLVNLIIAPKTTTARLEPIIPFVTIGAAQVPFFLFALGLSVLLHELSHAVSSTSNKVKVRGGGILLIFLFPGAFVEPDEEELKNASLMAKLKIISIGIAVNLILAGVFYVLVEYAVPLMSKGLLIQGVINGTPAYYSGIRAGDIILAVNSTRITEPYQLESALHASVVHNITLLLTNGSIVSLLVKTPQHFLGVYITYYLPHPYDWFAYFIFWMFVLNFSLGVLNGAPLLITDGGKIATEILKKYLGENGEKISFYLQSLMLFLLIAAVMLSVST
ncbi:MAG: site-2 protease family protein [Sulfolobaceae archaeon]|nr:site-2 protease family protein [Sulfolobaceae archaeon]